MVSLRTLNGFQKDEKQPTGQAMDEHCFEKMCKSLVKFEFIKVAQRASIITVERKVNEKDQAQNYSLTFFKSPILNPAIRTYKFTFAYHVLSTFLPHYFSLWTATPTLPPFYLPTFPM
jgi:hypothetical protein